MIRKGSAFVAVGLASLLLLEGLVRLSGLARHLHTDPAFVLVGDGSHWEYRPGFAGTLLGPTDVAIGPLGQRLAPNENVDGTLRVAIFGDSMTLGQAVPAGDTFSALLERRLRQRWPESHVFNFGVQGHTVTMEVAHLAARRDAVRPAFVALVFGTDDLNPARQDNRVDRFGYLTKASFGPPSLAGDVGRALLRRSHLALAVKDAYLHSRTPATPPLALDAGTPPPRDERALAMFREAITRFDRLTHGLPRVVFCLDPRDSPLARDLARLMRSEFPHIAYLEAAPALAAIPLPELRVPRDGHPNARAHALYADLLGSRVEAALAAAPAAGR